MGAPKAVSFTPGPNGARAGGGGGVATGGGKGVATADWDTDTTDGGGAGHLLVRVYLTHCIYY